MRRRWLHCRFGPWLCALTGQLPSARMPGRAREIAAAVLSRSQIAHPSVIGQRCLICHRHGKSFGWLLLAARSHQKLCDHAHVCNTMSKVCLVLSLAACMLQAELEEERMANQREFNRAQDVGAMALEQQQSLDLCVKSLMVVGTNLCDAKEPIEVTTCSCTVLPVPSCPAFVLLHPLRLSLPHHLHPLTSLFPLLHPQPTSPNLQLTLASALLPCTWTFSRAPPKM